MIKDDPAQLEIGGNERYAHARAFEQPRIPPISAVASSGDETGLRDCIPDQALRRLRFDGTQAMDPPHDFRYRDRLLGLAYDLLHKRRITLGWLFLWIRHSKMG